MPLPSDWENTVQSFLMFLSSPSFCKDSRLQSWYAGCSLQLRTWATFGIYFFDVQQLSAMWQINTLVFIKASTIIWQNFNSQFNLRVHLVFSYPVCETHLLEYIYVDMYSYNFVICYESLLTCCILTNWPITSLLMFSNIK